MLTLTPVVCVLAAIAFSKTFDIYLKDDTQKPTQEELEEKERNDKYYDKVRNKKELVHQVSVRPGSILQSLLFLVLLWVLLC